jgi:hypothetical protein
VALLELTCLELEAAHNENRVRALVAERLQESYGDHGSVFTALVDDITAQVQKVLTQTSPTAQAPSASRPAGPAPTVWSTRPRWADRLAVQYHPPQRGSAATPAPQWRALEN